MESSDEDDVISGHLVRPYRTFQKGDAVIPFVSSAAPPYHALSNLAVVESGVTFKGIVYPTIEHAFQAQKFEKGDRPKFSVTGLFGNPENDFHSGWTALMKATFTRGKKGEDYDQMIESKVQAKIKHYKKKNCFGVIAKQVNTLAKGCKSRPSRIHLLGLTANAKWNFADAHEDLWLELIRSKFSDPAMRALLMSTGDAYLVEQQKRPTDQGFYSAYYDKRTGECHGCNDTNRNAVGKFLMKVRDGAKTRRRYRKSVRTICRRNEA